MSNTEAQRSDEEGRSARAPAEGFVSTEPGDSHLPRWSASLDSVLLARLRRPLVEPSVISTALARRVFGWVTYFEQRRSLAAELQRRRGQPGGSGAERVPIVHARWLSDTVDEGVPPTRRNHEIVIEARSGGVATPPHRPAPAVEVVNAAPTSPRLDERGPRAAERAGKSLDVAQPIIVLGAAEEPSSMERVELTRIEVRHPMMPLLPGAPMDRPAVLPPSEAPSSMAVQVARPAPQGAPSDAARAASDEARRAIVAPRRVIVAPRREAAAPTAMGGAAPPHGAPIVRTALQEPQRVARPRAAPFEDGTSPTPSIAGQTAPSSRDVRSSPLVWHLETTAQTSPQGAGRAARPLIHEALPEPAAPLARSAEMVFAPPPSVGVEAENPSQESIVVTPRSPRKRGYLEKAKGLVTPHRRSAPTAELPSTGARLRVAPSRHVPARNGATPPGEPLPQASTRAHGSPLGGATTPAEGWARPSAGASRAAAGPAFDIVSAAPGPAFDIVSGVPRPAFDIVSSPPRDAPAAPTAAPAAARAAINIDVLTDKVQQKLLRRLAAEQERKGGLR
ncbi:Basic proline-rich protein precursor [Minicystis rosea]|nr:Basic proline-rich protein precursor [Minicystis rosea]